MNFCLDDGEWLDPDEVENDTRILPSDRQPSEAPTRQKIARTDETAVLPTDALEKSQLERTGKPSMKAVFGAVLALIIVLAAGFGFYRMYRPTGTPKPLPTVESERLTGDGKVREAAISPDGKFLAYLDIRGNEKAMRVKQIETNSTVEILKEGDFEDINNVTFSPDGNFVYFGGIDRDRKISVYKVATLGGTPISVPIKAMTFSLSPDGKRIAYYEEDGKTTETAISVANLDGTGARKIASRNGRKWIDPGTSWSPDGNSLIICEGDDDREPNPLISLAIYSLKDETVRSLGSGRWDRIDNSGIAWDPSGDSVYLIGSASGGEPMRIWRVSIPDGETAELTNNEKDYRGLSITADGTRLVTSEEEIRSGIWVSPDLDPMNAVEALPARGDTWSLDWTPDGRIVYISNQSGAPEVWSMNADGTDQKQLTNDRIAKSTPSVSPDGKTVVYHSPIDGFQLFKVPIGGGSPSRIETGQTGPEDASFSPDGKYIIFTAWPDGKQSIFRMPAGGGRAERLTNYFSVEPRYSPDGSAIACFFIAPDDQYLSLGVISAEGGAPVKKFRVPLTSATSRGPLWTPDGKSINYLVLEGEKTDLWAQPLDGGDPVRLTDFDRPWIQRRAYSRDGNRIAITRGESLRNAVMLKLTR